MTMEWVYRGSWDLTLMTSALPLLREGTPERSPCGQMRRRFGQGQGEECDWLRLKVVCFALCLDFLICKMGVVYGLVQGLVLKNQARIHEVTLENIRMSLVLDPAPPPHSPPRQLTGQWVDTLGELVRLPGPALELAAEHFAVVLLRRRCLCLLRLLGWGWIWGLLGWGCGMTVGPSDPALGLGRGGSYPQSWD